MDTYKRHRHRSRRAEPVFLVEASPTDSSSVPSPPRRSHRDGRPVLSRRASFPPLKPLSKKPDLWVDEVRHDVPTRHVDEYSSDEPVRPRTADPFYAYEYVYEKGPYERPRSHMRPLKRNDFAEWAYAKRHTTSVPPVDKRYAYPRDAYPRDDGREYGPDYPRHRGGRGIPQPPPPPPPPPPPQLSPSRAKAVRRRAAADMIMGVHDTLRSDGMGDREITDFFKDSIIEARRRS